MGRALVYRLALAGGIAMIAYGVSLWSVAAAFVVTGVLVAGAGVAGLYGLEAGGEG